MEIINLNDFEYGVYSQNGEDGIIRYLAILFETPRKIVEIGTGNGIECNSRLPHENGWDRWGFDAAYGDPQVGITHAVVTPGNINGLLEEAGVPNYFGVLSIDVDMHDFHLWNALDERYTPDIVVIEYNASYGLADKLAPYDPGIKWTGTDYFGASITALNQLAKKKGYTLVYAESTGTNLFFVDSKLLTYPARGFRYSGIPSRLFRLPTYGAVGKGHPKHGDNGAFIESCDVIGVPTQPTIPRRVVGIPSGL